MNKHSLRQVLFCTDFSGNADFAFRYALDAAIRRPGCTLHIFHVIPEPDAQFWKTYMYEVDDVDIDAKARGDIDAKIRDAYLSKVPPELQTEVTVEIGKDSAKILDFAAARHVDLIVMGRQGHSALGKVLFGNVTEKVVRKARCPVLVVPTDFMESEGTEPAADDPPGPGA